MGFFSWITQDTDKSIANRYSELKPFQVTMTDDKGNRWTEYNYEGYGTFGGKDYYQLLAEMSRPNECTGDVGHDRRIGISLAFGVNAIKCKKTGQVFKANNIDFFSWDEPLVDGLEVIGKPNELIKGDDWERIVIKEDGVKFPNLTEDPDHEWVNEEPESCDAQGYFYDWV